MSDQERLWDHYQNDRTEVFDQSAPRLGLLFRMARRRSRGRERRALNIGIGNGWLERRCLRAGWQVAALDPSRRSVEALSDEGVDARVGLIQNLPFDDSSFDVVFCSEVLEHLDRETMSAGLREIARCLRPDGVLAGSVPHRENLAESVVFCPNCGESFHRWGHQQSFSPGAIRQILHEHDLEPLRLQRRSFLDLSRATAIERALYSVHWLLRQLGASIGGATLCFVARKRTLHGSRR